MPTLPALSRSLREGPLARVVPLRVQSAVERWTIEHAYPLADAPVSLHVRAEPATASLMFGGDVALHRWQAGASAEQLLGGLATAMRGSDARIVNLETQLTARATPAGIIGSSLRAEPATLDLLSSLRIDVANCANNHCLDFGPEALAESASHLQSRGISVIGIDERGAHGGVVINVRGIRVGLLGFTDDWRYAGPEPVTLAPVAHDESLVRRSIAALEPLCDLVAVQLHWGYEWAMHPMRSMRDLARSYIDVGAGIVACHHAHVPMGVEIWRHGVIAHGLGNLYFGPASQRRHPFRSSSFLLRVGISKAGVVGADVIPVRTHADGRVAQVSGADAVVVHGIVAYLSSRLGDDAYVDAVEAWFVANAGGELLLDLTRRISALDERGVRERIHTLRTPRQRWLIAHLRECGGPHAAIGALFDTLRRDEMDAVPPSLGRELDGLVPLARQWMEKNPQIGRLP